MANHLYAATLILSFVCGSAALGAAAWTRFRPADRSARLVTPAAAASWIALVASVAVHLGWGHTPGGPAALSPMGFLREHVSFLLAAALPAVALLVSAERLRRWSSG